MKQSDTVIRFILGHVNKCRVRVCRKTRDLWLVEHLEGKTPGFRKFGNISACVFILGRILGLSSTILSNISINSDTLNYYSCTFLCFSRILEEFHRNLIALSRCLVSFSEFFEIFSWMQITAKFLRSLEYFCKLRG